MGYYTRYELTTGPQDDLVKDLGFDPFGLECRWYSHEQDIAAFMRRSNVEHIDLSCLGEENGDKRAKIFKLDKTGKVTVTIVKYVYTAQPGVTKVL
jgi:hypothetical protein